MIRSKNISWLTVGIVALVAAMADFTHAASPASADEAAIRAQTTSWVKAYNGGDAKAVAALYAEDALLLPPGAPGVRGRAAILEFIAKDAADSKAAGAVFAVDPKTVKGAVVENGKFLSVSRKKDGKWLYIRDTWNADTPPAPSAAVAAPPATKK